MVCRCRNIPDCHKHGKDATRAPDIASATTVGLLARREYLDRERERSRFSRDQCPNANYLAIDLLAALVPDRDDHRILPRLICGRRTNRTIDLESGETRMHALGRGLARPQMMPAAGTHVGAFENRRPAVRTATRLSRRSLVYRTHVTLMKRSCAPPSCPNAVRFPLSSRIPPGPASAIQLQR